MPHRYLAVVIHDVAPSTWSACQRLMTMVQAEARAAGVRVPLTLLTVPAFHGEPATAPFVRWLHHESRHGHELALHGLTHQDEAPPPRSWRERFLRRWYTAGEGEFAALDSDEARERLLLGKRWARGLRLPMQGFVAPAWLLSDAAFEAVEQAGFAYTCTLTELVAWPGRRRLHARSLVFSTRAWWRRALSVLWNSALAWWMAPAPLMRLELHPGDADHPAVRRCWRRILRRALREQHRHPLRLHEAAAHLRPRSPRTGPRDAMAAA